MRTDDGLGELLRVTAAQCASQCEAARGKPEGLAALLGYDAATAGGAGRRRCAGGNAGQNNGFARRHAGLHRTPPSAKARWPAATSNRFEHAMHRSF